MGWEGVDSATKRWRVVLASGRVDSPQAAAAWEELCCSYWHPLYAFVRRQGYSPPDVEDLVQAFFAHLLERRCLECAGRFRGRLRPFLLASLKHLMADTWDKLKTQKRGG